jgi:hypothetical protein
LPSIAFWLLGHFLKMAVFSPMAVDSSWGNVCVSQVQCNPLKAFALASYGKQAVALRLGAQFKIVQFELRLVRRCLAARYWLLFALSEDRQTTPTRLAGGLQFYGTLPRRPACFCASHLWHSVRQESVVILVR